MTRGYYTVLSKEPTEALGVLCPHRHYDLNASLARCLRERGGEAVYVDDQGQRRPLRLDEAREVRAHG